VSLLLSGCVDYDVGIQFESPHRGAITQHIQIGQQLRSFGQAGTDQWLTTIEQRSRALGGRLEKRTPSDWLVTIPFTTHADLEQKFNQLFGPPDLFSTSGVKLPPVKSNLQLTRSNFLLFERNHLQYDVDLRSLGVLSSSGDLLLSPGSLVNLEFRLKTPWGARGTGFDSNLKALQNGQELVWRLVPGEQNHLEASFWLPSPLGIGTVVIGLLVFLGIYLRYPQTFQTKPSPTSTPASQSDTAL
jgi:hypothetical protein